ncbi:hypothetical protein CPB83DRAFT_877814 [Crepidotus variabilis]|uniref:Integrase catalytic domain-containing protein n=1 Tax=Crepidotus variabilis TaxID=179855 RepID=A0A9P6E7M4_9AGAR|nr:hypothetical protein CPB83DRAFT_877814 [Crepidotus variabilis]
MASHNRNPTGRNQYPNAPTLDNKVFVEALKQYHREHISSNKVIKERLSKDHQIETSESNIKNKRNNLGLYGSRSKKGKRTEQEIEQTVLNQMDKDVVDNIGVPTTTARIAFDQREHIPRDKVRAIMKLHRPEGFERRNPGGRKTPRTTVTSIGINERWAADGHDKLNKIGFPIYAVVDFATGKILGAWVVPNNRLGSTVAYLFLSLIEQYKGIPLQFSTDCGSETTMWHGIANALREFFHSDIDIAELAAHNYMKSIHNILSERSWLRLRLVFVDNAVAVFERGVAEGIYDPIIPIQEELCRWLWAKLLRQDLASYVYFQNTWPGRKVPYKATPSGVARDTAYKDYHQYGMDDYLQPLTTEQVDVVRELKELIGGERPLAFSSEEFDVRAQAAYDELEIKQLNTENVWHLFEALLTRLV